MPSARPDRLRRAVAVAALLGAAATVAACGERDATEPGLPTMDTTPAAVLVIDDDGLAWVAGPAGTVDVDPARWTTPTLVEVRNDSDRPRRLRAGTRFDTGTLEPGESTLVLFDDELTAPTTYVVTDAEDPDTTLPFELVPPAGG